MSTYIPFTDLQKLQAANINLPIFLQNHGVGLERCGNEYSLTADPYIKIRGNNWYDHGSQHGGNAISFVKKLFGLTYPEAVRLLLGECADIPPAAHEHRKSEKVIFALPPASRTMRRLFAYLSKERRIPVEIISHFVKTKTLYESAEPSKDGSRIYHNIIFVGHDKDGVPRHASKHGTYSATPSFKGNVAGSDPAYSFHHIGRSKAIFVFEAPIDLLSYIALHPVGWEKHSYVALCGVSEHALL